VLLDSRLRFGLTLSLLTLSLEPLAFAPVSLLLRAPFLAACWRVALIVPPHAVHSVPVVEAARPLTCRWPKQASGGGGGRRGFSKLALDCRHAAWWRELLDVGH